MAYNLDDPNQELAFRQQAQQQGVDQSTIDSYVASQKTSSPQALPSQTQLGSQNLPDSPKSISGFLGNVVKSGGQAIGSIGNALLHPIKTAGDIGNLGLGAVELAIPGEQGSEKYARAAGQYYKNRYGGLSNIGNTLYNDPVGALLDASTVADLGGSALGKIGDVSKIEELANAGKVAKDVADVIDPLQAVGKGVSKIASKVVDVPKNILSNIEEEAAASATKATGSQIAKAIEEHGVNPNELYMKYITPGADDTAILGTPAAKGWGGIVGQKMSEAESAIQNTIKTSGDNVIASAESFVQPLEQQKLELAKTIGNSDKIAKLDDVIAEIRSKFKDGLTAQDMMDLKRSADSTFGKAVVEDTAGTITNQAQKMIGNQSRGILKETFPEIADALQQQSDMYTLQPILNKTRGTNLAEKLNLGKYDVTRPGTFIDPTIRNPQVASRIADLTGKISDFGDKIGGVGIGSKLGTAETLGRDITRLVPASMSDTGQENANYNDANGNPQIGADNSSNHTSLSSSPSLDQTTSTSIAQSGDTSTQSKPNTLNQYGASLQDIEQAWEKASAAGDKRNADIIAQMYTREAAYQKSLVQQHLTAKDQQSHDAMTRMYDDLNSRLKKKNYNQLSVAASDIGGPLGHGDPDIQQAQADMVFLEQLIATDVHHRGMSPEALKAMYKGFPQIGKDSPQMIKSKMDALKILIDQSSQTQPTQEGLTTPVPTNYGQGGGNAMNGLPMNPADCKMGGGGLGEKPNLMPRYLYR